MGRRTNKHLAVRKYTGEESGSSRLSSRAMTLPITGHKLSGIEWALHLIKQLLVVPEL